jgi:competence protein ComEC
MRWKFLFALCTVTLSLQAQERPLEIYWIDVEGGAATLVVTPARQSILVDTGDDLERDVSRVVDVAVRHAGLKQIDHFVATHFHADHFGGVSKLGQRIPVKRFYDHGNIPAQLPDDPAFARLIQLYREATGGRSTALKPGDFIALRQSTGKPKIGIECLASDRRVGGNAGAPKNPVCSGGKPPEKDQTDNSRSVVLKLTYGQFTFLDGGDLTRDIEEKLACPVNRIGTVDLYLTDAHGMDVGNSAVFVHSIRPRVVVVNNGPMKGAEPDTMKTLLSSSGIESVWQVHRNLKTAADLNTAAKLIANEQQECAAQFIKAAVRADGSFSLRIGATGREQMYKPH